MPPSRRPPKRPSKRPSTLPEAREPEPFPPIPPPPDTKPEGVGVVLTPNEEPEGPEAYYKAIHAHRTVLAMRVPKDAPTEPRLPEETNDAPARLLKRVFDAERETALLRERLAEVTRERDVARGEALALRRRLSTIRDALDR